MNHRGARRLACGVAVLVAGLASAQDGGVSFGFSVGPPLGPFTAPLEVPLWVDSAERVYSQQANQQGIRCYATDGGAPRVLGTPGPVGAVTLFAREGSDTVVMMEIPFGTMTANFRSDVCGSPVQNLGSASLQPLQFPTGGVHSIDTDGALLYPSSSGVVRVALSPAPAVSTFVSKAELVALLGTEGAAPDAGLDADRLQVVGVRRNAVGALVLVVERRAMNGSNLLTWLVERSAGGALSVKWGPDRYLTRSLDSLVDWPALGASVASGYTREVGSLPGARPASEWKYPVLALAPHAGGVLRDEVPPWPNQPAPGSLLPGASTWRTLIGSSSGAPYVLANDNSGQLVLHRLGYVAQAADFDRDGLKASEEAALGTSDFQADSDRDGVADGLERVLFASDPADAGSVPDAGASDDEVVLAPSVLAHSWPEMPDPSCARPYPYAWGPAVCYQVKNLPCIADGGRTTCIGEDLKPLVGSPFATPPRFSAELDALWRPADPGAWFSRPYPSGMESRVTVPYSSVADTLGPVAIDGARALFFEVPLRAWRTDGASSFAVVDAERTACPILPNAAALARCGDPAYSLARVTAVVPQGYDRQRKRVIVSVTTEQSRFLLGIGADDVAFMGDTLALTRGFPVAGIIGLPGGGWNLQLGGGAVIGTVRLGASLSRVPAFQPAMTTVMPVPRFGPGFWDSTSESFWLEPPPSASQGGCSTGGFGDTLLVVCDVRPEQPPAPVPYAFLTRWLPVGPAVEKGEVIIWSAARYRGGTVDTLERDGFVDLDHYTQVGWMLWRYTPLGAVAEWLTADGFAARLSPADRATLGSAPLGPIHDMGASPDGTKLCLAEPGAGRAWELQLDAQTRRLASVRLAASGGVTACAYDEANQLAWVGGSPVTFHSGARAVPVGVGRANALVRTRGVFLVQAEGEPVRCVKDDDTVTQGIVTMSGVAEALGELAYVADVADAGVGLLGTADRLCVGGGSTESLLDHGVPFWTMLYNPLLTFRTASAAHTSLAVRPDGLLLAAPRDVAYGGLGAGPNGLAKNLLFHVFPRYRNLSGTERFTQFDAFRAKKEVSLIGARQVANVGAMVLIPGAEPSRDWGYPTRPGEHVAPLLPVDAGMMPPAQDGGTTEGPMPGKPCGCSAVEGTMLLATLALCWRRRARARAA